MQLGRRERLRVSSPDDPKRIRPGANALTASGVRVRAKNGDALRRLVQPWQARAFAYYDMLGEIKYASQFYARGLSQLRLYPAVKDENGDLVEVTEKDGPDAKVAVEALARIQDPGGGQSGLLSAYGRLMFLVGEALLFVSNDEEGDEQWEMLSTDEIRIMGNNVQRVKAPSMNAEEYKEPSEDDDGNWEDLSDKEAVAYRLWQRHPRYSMLADSTMQGVLDLCEELVLLTQSVRARTRSRLAGAGIMFLDDRIDPAPPKPTGDEDPEEDIFLSDLTEAMTAPIADEGAASAVVPMVVRATVPDNMSMKDLVYHLEIVDPMQLYPETGLRYELIKRIAIGLDMPPEILMGLGDSNHWSAWQVDEQTWKGHLQPKAQQFVDDLTSSYFRPQLKQDGVQDYKDFSVAYDATAIINHPDRTKDAKDLHEKMAISDHALREAGGFDDDDAIQDEDEWTRRIGVKVNDGYLATKGEVSQITDINAAKRVAEGGTIDSGTSSPDVLKEPPSVPTQPPDENVIGGGNGHHEDSIARILGAADLALFRAREAAGNRIRSLAKKDPDALALLDGVRAGQVCFTLGRERVRALRADPLELVSGARDLIVDALRVYGITDEDVVERITENVERHAARTLYDERPSPLPDAFANYVAAITERAPV